MFHPFRKRARCVARPRASVPRGSAPRSLFPGLPFVPCGTRSRGSLVRGGGLVRGDRLSGVCFICPPHCFLVPCWQRACSTGPFFPGPCSPVLCIPGSAVVSMQLASLLPAHMGTTPPFTPPARLRSRGESNVIITHALVMLAAVMT